MYQLIASCHQDHQGLTFMLHSVITLVVCCPEGEQLCIQETRFSSPSNFAVTLSTRVAIDSSSQPRPRFPQSMNEGLSLYLNSTLQQKKYLFRKFRLKC